MSNGLEAFRDKYREHLTILNYAAGTIKGHRFYLKCFFDYLREMNITEITGITKDVLRDYQTHLYEEINFKGQPNCVLSQNNKLKGVNASSAFLQRMTTSSAIRQRTYPMQKNLRDFRGPFLRRQR